MITIYSLSDPRTNEVKYIGQTRNIHARFSAHMVRPIRKGKPTKKEIWVKELKALGLVPILSPIETVAYEKRFARERFWIDYYGGISHSLCNRAIPPNGHQLQTKSLHIALRPKHKHLFIKVSRQLDIPVSLWAKNVVLAEARKVISEARSATGK